MTTYTQQPVWYHRLGAYGVNHFYAPSEVMPENCQALYTHPAPMSKEDMVKVLEALAQSKLWHQGDKWRFMKGEAQTVWESQRDRVDEAIEIMKGVRG